MKTAHPLTSVDSNKATPVDTTGGFYECWRLRFSNPSEPLSFELIFQLIHSENGFRRSAEVIARIGMGSLGPHSVRTQLRTTASLDSLNSHFPLSVCGCHLSENSSRGSIRKKGRVLEWELHWNDDPTLRFSKVPPIIEKWSSGGVTSDSTFPRIQVSGWVRIDGKEYRSDALLGTYSHSYSQHRPREWAYAQSSHFVDAQKNPIPMLFEGMSAKYPIWGTVGSLKNTTLFLRYQDVTTQFVSLPHFLRIRSHQGLNSWKFEAEQGDLKIRGSIEGENREFITGTEEDTDGSFLHVANAPLASMELLLFRREKLEVHAFSHHSVSLEIASPNRNPYLAGLPGSN